MRRMAAVCLLAWACVGASGPLHGDAFVLPSGDGDVVGWEAETAAGQDDTLADIARLFQVGHTEIRLANPDVDFWLPGAGARVVVPTRYVLPKAEREGIVLNVPEMRLYYYPATPRFGDPVVVTFPVSIGRMDWSTPIGRHRVTSKVKDPSWTPPKSIIQEALAAGEPPPKFMPPGPNNPLGAYAIRLDIPGYLIHGTDRPYGVGMRVTHGCVRMYPEDIERLFPQVAVGTPVNIVNQPVKVGWLRDTVFMEVHPPLDEDPQDDETLQGMAWELIEEVVGDRPVELVVPDLLRAISEKRGLPIAISRGSEM